jgi:hypothetical protein
MPLRIRRLVLAFLAVASLAMLACSAGSEARGLVSHAVHVRFWWCEPPLLAPRDFSFTCDTAMGGPPTTVVSGVRYHHYGYSTATASGTVRACLLRDAAQVRVCQEYWGGPPEERPVGGTTEGPFPAVFLFSSIVSCRWSGNPKAQLFYSRFSYRFAGLPWTNRAIGPVEDWNLEERISEVANHGEARPTCRPVRSSRA